MQKFVFFDRDGVINNDVDHYYIFKQDDFKINIGIISAMHKLQQNGFNFIVISNQGGISKGIYSKNDVQKVHDKFLNILEKEKIMIQEIYYCPHHSDIENCICRKPDSLMIEKAIARFDVDVSSSYFIGDSGKDIKAAEKAGITGIKIASNENVESILNLIING